SMGVGLRMGRSLPAPHTRSPNAAGKAGACDLPPRARGPLCAILNAVLSVLHRDLDIRTVPALFMMKAKTTAFDSLNPSQRRAATFGTPVADQGVDAGPLLILAGAGTGKTNTLAHRTAHLVRSGVAPERIPLLTFSRRAAQEMTRRAQRIVAESLKEVRLPWSGTFHAIATRWSRSHAQRVGLAPAFTVLDRGDAADLLDVLRHELGLSKTEKRFPRKDTCLAIYSHRVNTQGSLADTLQTVFP